MNPDQSASWRRSRTIAAMVVFAILSASIVLVSSELTLIAGPQHPEIAVDICHPLQLASASPRLLLAYPRVSNPLTDSEGRKEPLPTTVRQILKGNVKPDVPPPRPLV